jgi:hypothetical protein
VISFLLLVRFVVLVALVAAAVAVVWMSTASD